MYNDPIGPLALTGGVTALGLAMDHAWLIVGGAFLITIGGIAVARARGRSGDIL